MITLLLVLGCWSAEDISPGTFALSSAAPEVIYDGSTGFPFPTGPRVAYAGDGVSALLVVGQDAGDVAHKNSGWVDIYAGPWSGRAGPAELLAGIGGAGRSAHLGSCVAAIPNGSGFNIAVGRNGDGAAAEESGAIIFYDVDDRGVRESAVLLGEEPGGWFGTSCGYAQAADGEPLLAVGAPTAAGAAALGGVVTLFEAPTESFPKANDAVGRIDGVGEYAGGWLTTLGDIDGDGGDELAAGATFIWPSTEFGLSQRSSSLPTLPCDAEYYASLVAGADVDGDGYRDVLCMSFALGGRDIVGWYGGVDLLKGGFSSTDFELDVFGDASRVKTIGDVDGDGREDLLTGDQSTSLLFGAAFSGFQTPGWTWEMRAALVDAFPVGDWNADGFSDVGYFDGQTAWVLDGALVGYRVE